MKLGSGNWIGKGEKYGFNNNLNNKDLNNIQFTTLDVEMCPSLDHIRLSLMQYHNSTPTI